MVDLIISTGFFFTLGALACILIIQIAAQLPALFAKRDDSDAPKGPRSGFHVLTDHLTGNQYLMTRQGFITPRYDTNGFIINTNKDKVQ